MRGQVPEQLAVPRVAEVDGGRMILGTRTLFCTCMVYKYNLHGLSVVNGNFYSLKVMISISDTLEYLPSSTAAHGISMMFLISFSFSGITAVQANVVEGFCYAKTFQIWIYITKLYVPEWLTIQSAFTTGVTITSESMYKHVFG